MKIVPRRWTVPSRDCSKCGQDKPLTTDHWYRDRSRVNGFFASCKDCNSQHRRAYGRDELVPDIACEQCGKMFRPRYTDTRFCGRKCRADAETKRKPHDCPICGKEVTARQSNTCSKTCAAELKLRNFPPPALVTEIWHVNCKLCSRLYIARRINDNGICGDTAAHAGPVAVRLNFAGKLTRCPDCNEEKPLTSEFWHRHKSSKNGFQRVCKFCNTKSVTLRQSKHTIRLRELKETTPCADCSQYFPFYVMDFDHLDGETKAGEIGRMASGTYRWETIAAEIAKCQLVCANCHRFRTYYRKNGGVL